jgi:glycosyltransferase involved in cell wall biosynthesis
VTAAAPPGPPPYPLALSAVVFTYNEGAHLEAVLRRTVAELAALCARWELIVVDDGSTDGSPALLAALAAELPGLRLLRHPHNRGIGEAVHSGYAAATLDYVCILPADGQITMAAYAPMLPELLAGADMALARYRGRGEADGAHRELLSHGLRALNWLLLGVGERINAAFVFRRALLAEVPLKTRSFYVNVELPLRLLRGGYRVAFVDLEVQPRVGGSSKVLRLDRVATVARDVLLLRGHLWRERWLGR